MTDAPTTREIADPTSLHKVQTSADHAELARLAEPLRMTPDHSALIERLDLIVAELEGLPHVKQTAAEAAAALRDLTEWRTMESAPKDGKCTVWCATDDGGEARVLDRNGKGDWLYEGEPTFCHGFYIEPVAWLPLPSAPNQAKEAGE